MIGKLKIHKHTHTEEPSTLNDCTQGHYYHVWTLSGQMSCLEISQTWEMIPGGKLKFTAIGYFVNKIIVKLWDVDA